MTQSSSRKLHGCLRGFPAAALELTPAGIVVDSNGKLETLMRREVVGADFATLLDDSSQERWRQLLATAGSEESHLWELVLDVADTFELRTFAAVWGRDGEEALWLVEYARDLALVPMYEELAAANAEMAQAQRELAKERSRLARVLAQEAEARASAERASARLRALHAVSSSVLSEEMHTAIAGRLLPALRDAMRVDTASVFLLEEKGSALEQLAAVGLEADSPGPWSVPVEGTFIGRVARQRASLVERSPASSDVSHPFVRENMRSVAGAPLIVGSRVTGVLRVGSLAEDAFSADDMRVLELVARDIAAAVEHARLLEAEREARSKAERAVRLREEVLAIVAHDLKNPVDRVSQTAFMLAQEGLNADSRRDLHGVLDRTATHMNRLIRDLLDVASIESGRLSIDRQPMPVASLIADAVETGQAVATRRRVIVEGECAPDLPEIDADRSRLLQVLTNLVDNAVRVSSAGSRVVISAQRDGDGVRLEVRDSGPGISAEDLPQLFTQFWQGRRRTRGAAGLGLAIAKGIVEAHGGSIVAESTLGQGATFSIWLPRKTGV